ncbi:hypothetical protein BH11PLA2_BH11PLA2_25450 [soil metagenome]
MIDPAERMAAEELELPSTATAGEVRAAFLAAMTKENFVPSPKLLAAVNLFGGAKLKLPPEAEQVFTEYEAADLNHFVKEFLTLSPADRQSRWQRLKDRTRSSVLHRELDRLAVALPMVVQECQSESQQELVELGQELFLLPPRLRATKRSEWLSQHAQEQQFRDAAKQLKELSRPDPPLFEALLHHPFAVYQVKGISEEQREKYADEAVRTAERDLRIAQRVAREQEKAPTSGTGLKDLGWGLYLVGAILLALIRGCVSQMDNKSTPKPTYSPSYTPSYKPSAPQGSFSRERFNSDEFIKKMEQDSKIWNDRAKDVIEKSKANRRKFTAEEEIKYLRYIPKSGQPEPEGYREWLRSKSEEEP